jgi:hypothetical protein
MKSLQKHIEKNYSLKENLQKKIAEETYELEKKFRQLESGVNKIKQLQDSDAIISAEIEQLKAAIKDLDIHGSERTSEDLHRANNQGQKTRKKLESIFKELQDENIRLNLYVRNAQKTYQSVQMQYEIRQREHQSTKHSTINFSENTTELTDRIENAARQLGALSFNLRKPVRGSSLESQLSQSPLEAIRAQLNNAHALYTPKKSPVRRTSRVHSSEKKSPI